MIDEQPSVTAQRAALRRAQHQVLDSPRVFEDPLALRIAGVLDEAEFQEDLRQPLHVLRRYLRAFLAVRSRYAEDELAKAVERGVRQYVILGAGLDTFAYRAAYPDSVLRVFEVDHPATQAWKRRRLQEAGIPTPKSVVFAPLDFSKQALDEGLEAVGFDRKAPAFFSWLGVTPYLAREAIMATLRGVVSSMAEGSEVVFDYATTPHSLTARQQAALKWMTEHVAAIGEPWVSFFEPAALRQQLLELGFRRIEDLGGDELNERYLKDRADQLRVGIMGRILKAGI